MRYLVPLLLAAVAPAVDVMLINDDWPVPPDQGGEEGTKGDDAYTCGMTLDAERFRAAYRILTDNWNTGTRSDELELVMKVSHGFEVGVLAVGDLGGKGLQNSFHSVTGDAANNTDYEGGRDVYALAGFSHDWTYAFADVVTFAGLPGVGYRAAAGARLAYEGMDLRVGATVDSDFQPSSAAEFWRGGDLVEPYARGTIRYHQLIFSIELSERRTRGGIGFTF